MHLSGPQRKQLRVLLQDCYPEYDDLKRLLMESVNLRLQDIAPRDKMDTVVFNLIEWGIAKGRITEIVQAAAADNPSKMEFHAFLQGFTFAKSAEGEVERIVHEKVGFENVAQWIDKFSALRRRICRIEPQPSGESKVGFGTGFLVAKDVVLTCFHVKDKFKQPGQVILRFDYEDDTQQGKPWKLAADNWLLAESPVEQFDYAFLKLQGPAADEVIGGGPRGFIQPQPLSVEAKEPIVIVQHPDAQPLKLSLGTVEIPKTANDRLTYTANTLGGASGSPVMNMKLQTLAHHHYGASASNRGVLWNAVLADLHAQGKANILG